MLTGIPLLALAFATILGTIVVILRVDGAGAIGRSLWHRLWLILTAWMWYGNMEVARRRFAFMLPASSALLYWIGAALDSGYQSDLATSWYLVAARLVIPPGAVFGYTGLCYSVMYMMISLRQRAVLLATLHMLVGVLSLALAFLHLFAFGGQRPAISDWT